MPAPAPPLSKSARAMLDELGARLQTRREALKVNQTTAAEAAGMSRVTLHRIERGEASVTMGAYVNAALAVGLDIDVVDHNEPKHKREAGSPLPRRIRVADYPQLKRLAWQLGAVATLTPKETLSLYERNWKHVD